MPKKWNWARLYAEASPGTERKLVLREFLEGALVMIHQTTTKNIDGVEPLTLKDALEYADKQARHMACGGADLFDGWRAHETWFRSGFVQLSHAGGKGKPGSAIAEQRLMEVFALLGWDYVAALHPKWSRVLSLCELEFLEDILPDGSKKYGIFKAIVEPTAEIPEGSSWRSRISGNVWEVNGYDEARDMFEVESEIKDKNGNKKIKIDYFEESLLLGMERIV